DEEHARAIALRDERTRTDLDAMRRELDAATVAERAARAELEPRAKAWDAAATESRRLATTLATRDATITELRTSLAAAARAARAGPERRVAVAEAARAEAAGNARGEETRRSAVEDALAAARRDAEAAATSLRERDEKIATLRSEVVDGDRRAAARELDAQASL